MTRNKHLRWIWLVVIGAFLGAVLGNAIGASIHSDNLPFFGALGAAVGMGFGAIKAILESGRAAEK